MPRSLTISQAKLVLPDRCVRGDLIVEDGVITEISPNAGRVVGEHIDGRGRWVLPGLVDSQLRLDQVDHITEVAPALLAGGFTSCVGVRSAVDADGLRRELNALADGPLHLGLYTRVDLDATNGVEAALAAHRALGVWIDADQLAHAEPVFQEARSLVLVDHRDAERLKERWHLWEEPPGPADLPRFYDIDTCVEGTRKALEFATRHGTRTHLLHVSTAEELQLLDTHDRLTASVLPPHLFADASLYERLGTRAVCVPPIRSPRHAEALWDALLDGRLSIATGHFAAPLAAKDQPLPHTHPGWPSAEWVLPLLLDAHHAGKCSLHDIACWTAARPAQILGLPRKGRLECGYDGDLVIVDPERTASVGSTAPIRTDAGWSPWEGRRLQGWPVRTVVAGATAWVDGTVRPARGRPLQSHLSTSA